MNAKEHINLALYSTFMLSTGYIIGEYMPITEIKENSVSIIVGVVVGSLLPDIDHPKSIAGTILPFHTLHSVFNSFKWYRKSNRIFKHGGITHTLLINIWIYYAGYFTGNWLVYGVAFGYFTHLYADHITGNKLPMLYYPITRRRKRK